MNAHDCPTAARYKRLSEDSPIKQQREYYWRLYQEHRMFCEVCGRVYEPQTTANRR